MDAVVEHGLGHVQGRYAGFFLQFLQRHHKLVHADPVVGHRKNVGQLHPHVIGVQHGVLRGLRNALASDGQQVGQCADHHQEIAAERPHVADGFRRIFPGQERRQELLAAAGTAARTAAAVRRGKCLVQVQVHHVKAHVARTCDAHDGIQVGAVVIVQPARLVYDAGDLQDLRVEESHRVGVGQHQAGSILPDGRLQGLQVHESVGVGGDADHLEARHGGAGRVRPVG